MLFGHIFVDPAVARSIRAEGTNKNRRLPAHSRNRLLTTIDYGWNEARRGPLPTPPATTRCALWIVLRFWVSHSFPSPTRISLGVAGVVGNRQGILDS